MNVSRRTAAASRPMRLLAATFVLALAAGLTQAVIAQPVEGPAMHRMAGMGGLHRMDRLLDSVNATADQRAQIKQIMEAAHADLKAQREAGRTLRDQSQALFTQPTVDARAAETLRQQMLARYDAASKRMLQARLDISRVLTPDQRQTLAAKMAERRALMEKHMAERAALDRPAR